MGISRNYATPFANDLMKAFRQGYKKGFIVHGTVGFAVGMATGCGVTVWILSRYNEKTQKKETTE